MAAGKKRTGRVGSSFDEFLNDEGIHAEVTARAIKRVVARALDRQMKEQRINKTMLAGRLKTSRSQVDRLLDPDNDAVTLGTLVRAARAVGRQLRVDLI